MSHCLKRTLGQAALNTDVAATRRDAFALATGSAYDLILLDLDVLDTSGHDLLCEMRAGGIGIPAIVLSHVADPDTKVKCFTAGADDYLTKPFDPRELIARIHAVRRRSELDAGRSIRIGTLLIKLHARTVEVAGAPVSLTDMEFRVLELLALRKSAPVTKAMIRSHLYGSTQAPLTNGVNVFISNLRKKLAQATGGEHHIETVCRGSYRLADPPHRGG